MAGQILESLDLSNRTITRVKIIHENGGLELTTINVARGRQTSVVEANKGLKVLKLNNNNITSIVNIFSININLRHLRILDISYNNLANNINTDLFSGLKHLEKLFLKHNYIENLDPETFSSLENLKDLDLSHNQLFEMEPNTFRPDLESLKSLKKLNLKKNRLRRIFEFLSPTLEKLNLSFNEIDEYDDDAFRRLESLDSLHLNNNRLKRILSNLFSQLKQLQFLHLNENEINEISGDALFECVNLYEINMANNMLDQLNDELFRRASDLNNRYLSLTSINLANNQLTRIDRDLFSSLYNLEVLNLSRNEIEEFGDGCFDDLRKLKVLQLEFNKFNQKHPSVIDRRLFRNLSSIKLLTLFDDAIIQTVSSFYKATNDYPYLRSENIQYIIGLFHNFDRINQPRQCVIPQSDINLIKPYKAYWNEFLNQFGDDDDDDDDDGDLY